MHRYHDTRASRSYVLAYVLPDGWQVEHTGGGHFALMYTFPDDRYILVTEVGEAFPPATLDDPCDAMVYNRDGEWMGEFGGDYGVRAAREYATLREALASAPVDFRTVR